MRRILAYTSLTSVMLLGLLSSSDLLAQTQAPAASSSSSASQTADNTQMNSRDRSSGTVTPTHQPNDKADITLAASVRRAVVKDKSLSMMAHNVKIVAANGAVTLRGAVKSDDEKTKVETVVKGVSGVSSIDNELDVKQ